MHIKEIVVDGFKSYARRTVIAGFDPHFNAITGLNGSGKSNILDSICFVLGITNLSEVRAKSLTELVYKQGQAGVTKATVSIVFDNNNNHHDSMATTDVSPVGYEHCTEITVTRQVQLGGKSKYMVNGKTTPANVVQNLFHSVQLNVNNPHFLIMQGRITKVLNMKPREILGMVEETAGTRMYETKKLAAVKTIAKKQLKVDEINSLLNEEITPTLERLRGEKQQYLKWSKNNADVERIERFVVASEYNVASKIVTSSLEELEAMQTQIDEAEGLASNYADKIELKSAEIAELSSKHGGEFEAAYTEAKNEEELMSKELVRVTSAWKNAQSSKENAKNDFTDAVAVVDECKALVEAKNNEINNDVNGIEGARAASQQAEQVLMQLKEQYQNMSAGISKAQESNSEDMTLPDRISKAHNDANSADARAKQAKMKLDHLTKSIKSVQKDMKKEEASSRKLTAKRDKAKSKVDAIKTEINSQFNGFSEEEFISLEDKKVEMENKTVELRSKVETTAAQLEGRLSFNYTDPVKGFDRSRVKGLVARLFTVQNQNHATALEVVAGKKLFQVIVDEATTAKALLNKGKLKKAVTIIPLDKITSRRISSSAAERASQMAASMNTVATPAIELITFDEEMRSAMEYVFGNTLVVDSMDAASKICDTTRTRVVTLQGDVFDPSGMISGGSSGSLGTTLSKLSSFKLMNDDLKQTESDLSRVKAQWKEMSSSAKRFGEANGKLELAMAELAAVEKHLSKTSYGMLSDKYTAMENEIDAAKSEITTMLEEKEKMWSLYNELQEKEEELKKERESRLVGIEQSIEDAKNKVAAAADSARQAESSSQTLQLELDALKEDLLAAEEAVVTAQKAVDEAELKETAHQKKVNDIRQSFDDAKQAFIELEEQMVEFKSALKELNSAKHSFIKKKEAAQLEAKKVSVKLAHSHKERGNSERVLKAMVKKHPWIQSEKDAFGVADGDYDFEKVDPVEMSHKLKSLKSEQSSLAKKINKKVMGMIEKAEGEYSELLRKRKVVENDKTKIEAVIHELDVKKIVELERTWTKVNRDFGSIFSTLLPGTSAKLEPPENMNAWEGLEVKVAFGNVWKESLSELSGGQRSLLALSLILSLLLFKPAPMYILDEVDAALDLSHTQNIGNMLKSHFSQSQFIVVSLKEGMFSNANVIFRTKFTDGVSTVARTLGIGRSKPRPLADSNSQEFDQNEIPFSKRSSKSLSRSTGMEN